MALGETGQSGSDVPVEPALAAWLADALGDPGPFTLRRLSGGNSNETLELRSPRATRVLRRPPAEPIGPGAHSMEREHRVLTALAPTDVPAPRPLAFCDDASVAGAPFLVMEAVDGVSLRDELPPGFPPPDAAAAQLGTATVRALTALHSVDWRAAGLEGFGHPERFLERQVARWSGQRERARHRDLPWFDDLGAWLEANRPPAQPPAILHGDFRLDNVLVTPSEPIAVAAIVDWEMATIGDPLLDLGLFLAFWGTARPARPALPQLQAVSRVPGAPSREELAAQYARESGRSIEHLRWYMVLALWKLAAVVEGAHAQYVAGTLRTEYARSLGKGVPRLLEEAAAHAGLRPSEAA